MRSALGRTRKLVALVMLGLSAWWLFLRRRAEPVWHDAPRSPGPELGAPGVSPAEVLATGAGLTVLPDAAGERPAVEPPAGTGDEAGVGALLADTPSVDEVDEVTAVIEDHPSTDSPPAGPADLTVAPAAVGGDEATEVFAPGVEDGIEEPTSELPRPTFAETPSPAFSDAPTMVMPVLMDDLRAVRGIGPSMERMLHGFGIVSFRQLALLDGTELEQVRDELRDFRSRIEREDWIGQARQLHKTKYGIDPS